MQNGSKQVKTESHNSRMAPAQLKDGMQEFNEQGTRKLKDTVEKELGNILDRLESLTSDQCSYDTFSGKGKRYGRKCKIRH